MRENFRRLVASSAASNLADGGFTLALPLVALSLTRSPAAFASVTFVARLPWLVFALPAGALADRLDRRVTMTAVSAFRAIAIGALALAVATGRVELWMLYVIGFGLGVGETLFDTAAQSLLPATVEADQLDRANGRLYAVEITTNQFLGPPLAAIIAAATLAGAVAASSALYLLAGVVLLTMTGKFRATRTGPSTTIRRDIADGVRYLVHHRLLRVRAVCVGVSNLASTAMISILPLYMISPGPIGLNETGYGFLLTTIAAGTVLGTLTVDRLRRLLGVRRTLLLATLSFPLFSLAPVISDSVAVIGLGLFIAGAVSISWNVITVSIRQRIVPDHLLGRVNAGYRLVAWGTMPLGAALGGVVANAFGIPTALLTSAAISSICTPLVYFGTTARQLQDAEGHLDSSAGADYSDVS
jgi:MFS family permease